MTNVYLIDGTYELFRAYFGAPSSKNAAGQEIGASRALLRSLTMFLRDPEVTHVAVAFDTVIESFRNRLFAGYKTGEGIDPLLHAQFPLAERVTRALGLTTWSMIEFETDDAFATAAARFAEDPRVAQVRITSPDKDFCQCVRGQRVVLFDRKEKRVTDEDGVRARLGVSPGQVAAWLALVGDTADGIPGIERWGEKSAATVLNRYGSIAAIPDDAAQWDIAVRGKDALAAELRKARAEAALYETLATLRTDVPLTETLDQLAWKPVLTPALEALCVELNAGDVWQRLQKSV
ncbi:MAG TPA: 5'-3' exonuclease H3TH domain-containing protein [Polyangiales bacterium]